jgi:hypothetical protein
MRIAWVNGIPSTGTTLVCALEASRPARGAVVTSIATTGATPEAGLVETVVVGTSTVDLFDAETDVVEETDVCVGAVRPHEITNGAMLAITAKSGVGAMRTIQ